MIFTIVLYIDIFTFLLCREEAQEYIEIGALNALFVLGRSMGFIGEFSIETLWSSVWILKFYE